MRYVYTVPLFLPVTHADNKEIKHNKCLSMYLQYHNGLITLCCLQEYDQIVDS